MKGMEKKWQRKLKRKKREKDRESKKNWKKTIEVIIVAIAIDRENKRRNRDGEHKWEIPFQAHNQLNRLKGRQYRGKTANEHKNHFSSIENMKSIQLPPYPWIYVKKNAHTHSHRCVYPILNIIKHQVSLTSESFDTYYAYGRYAAHRLHARSSLCYFRSMNWYFYNMHDGTSTLVWLYILAFIIFFSYYYY